ncbi:hypothetical protein [Mycobacterium sp. GA-1199]|uniref:hypothetical protein n=1 Tax=Mycobacterium sp. GA-1199 TaxID=1772287 RepID=UPI0012E36E5E|nr:hypothetical protein [Mycobacterium sp. GA-1199]
MVVGLTGELIQTQVLHNTTPIAERGVGSSFVIGIVVWLVIAVAVLAIRWSKNQRQKADAERQKQAAQQQQQERERQEKLRRHATEQQSLAARLQEKNNLAVDQFRLLPEFLSSAHRYLDSAEEEFRETAYVPFWTAIENATTELGEFIDSVNLINNIAAEYAILASRYEGPVDPFAVSLDATAKLHVSQGVSQRISQITRPAHKDPEFAKTFLLMRGNSIMVAGFANLGQALGRMTESLTSALAEVKSSIGQVSAQMSGVATSLDSLNYSTRSLDASTRSVEAGIRSNSTQLSSHFKEIERLQSRSVEKLDNIQRGRKPPYFV